MSLVSVVLTTRVRAILNDAGATSWTDAQLYPWHSDAVREILRRRSDARVKSDGTELAMVETTALSETRILSDNWIPAETDYVCARAFEMDAGDQRDMTRSKHHWQNFERLVGQM